MNLERIKKAEELLAKAHKVVASVKTKDEERNEAKLEVLSDINEVYKKLRNNFNTSVWGEVEQGENEMINKLSVNNLMNTYYDNGIYELQFLVDGMEVVIINIKEKDHPNAWNDQWYFENDEVIEEILRFSNDEDIIIVGEIK